MAGASYKTRALILRKTKLREKDLIVSLLSENGTLVSAVAKGARKPGGSHAARIELFRQVDLMLAKGSLDIICESKLSDAPHQESLSLEQTAAASPVAELLSFVAQQDLEQPRLYDLACASFFELQSAPPNELTTLCAASLWKILAQAGFRPSFDDCVICSQPALTRDYALFSAVEGGSVCEQCIAPSDAIRLNSNLAKWCAYLIATRFQSIRENLLQPDDAKAVLSLARDWTQVHIGKRIVSLDFLFTCGLFDIKAN